MVWKTILELWNNLTSIENYRGTILRINIYPFSSASIFLSLVKILLRNRRRPTLEAAPFRALFHAPQTCLIITQGWVSQLEELWEWEGRTRSPQKKKLCFKTSISSFKSKITTMERSFNVNFYECLILIDFRPKSSVWVGGHHSTGWGCVAVISVR